MVGAGPRQEARSLRAEGVEKFKAGDFIGSSHSFSAALHAVGSPPPYETSIGEFVRSCFVNRALCSLKTGQLDDAVADCNWVLERIEAADVLALFRKGLALSLSAERAASAEEALSLRQQARDAAHAASQEAPQDQRVAKLLAEVERQIRAGGGRISVASGAAGAAGGRVAASTAASSGSFSGTLPVQQPLIRLKSESFCEVGVLQMDKTGEATPHSRMATTITDLREDLYNKLVLHFRQSKWDPVHTPRTICAKRVFFELDVDNDGKVTVDELAVRMKEFGLDQVQQLSIHSAAANP